MNGKALFDKRRDWQDDGMARVTTASGIALGYDEAGGGERNADRLPPRCRVRQIRVAAAA